MVEAFTNEVDFPTAFGIATLGRFGEGSMEPGRAHSDREAGEDSITMALFSMGIVPNQLLHRFDLIIRERVIPQKAQIVVLDSDRGWILGLVSQKLNKSFEGSLFTGEEFIEEVLGQNLGQRAFPVPTDIGVASDSPDSHVLNSGQSFALYLGHLFRLGKKRPDCWFFDERLFGGQSLSFSKTSKDLVQAAFVMFDEGGVIARHF